MKRVEKMKNKMKEANANANETVLKAGKKAGKRAEKIVGEFKEFISRGNVTDMAVGIIVGTAFTAIVNSLVTDVVTPLIGLLMGGIDFTSFSVKINSFIFRDYSVTLTYGNFLQSVVRFFIIAVCVFFMVKTLNTLRRLGNVEPQAPKKEENIALLIEIRDLLKMQNGIPIDQTKAAKLAEATAKLSEAADGEEAKAADGEEAEVADGEEAADGEVAIDDKEAVESNDKDA